MPFLASTASVSHLYCLAGGCGAGVYANGATEGSQVQDFVLRVVQGTSVGVPLAAVTITAGWSSLLVACVGAGGGGGRIPVCSAGCVFVVYPNQDSCSALLTCQ